MVLHPGHVTRRTPSSPFSQHHDTRNLAPEKDLLVYLGRARRGKDAALVAACPDFASVDLAIWGGPAKRLPPSEGGALPPGYTTAAAETCGLGRVGSKGSYVFASEEGGTAAVRR